MKSKKKKNLLKNFFKKINGKGIFMKLIVMFCILYAVHLTEKSLNLCVSVGVSPEGVYVAAIAFFGAELIMTMVKKIMEKRKEDEIND